MLSYVEYILYKYRNKYIYIYIYINDCSPHWVYGSMGQSKASKPEVSRPLIRFDSRLFLFFSCVYKDPNKR